MASDAANLVLLSLQLGGRLHHYRAELLLAQPATEQLMPVPGWVLDELEDLGWVRIEKTGASVTSAGITALARFMKGRNRPITPQRIKRRALLACVR